jgi:hypothetical protein
MANTNIDLVGLDFTSLKNNLKTFLKTNTQFKDLDYEGSNINVLLDVLAYNAYLNAFYTNMVASEMFLDTAQLRDSVVSHAKELNYVPRSFTSSRATITVALTPSTTVSSLVIPKYTSFTSRVGSNTFTFSTNEALVVTTANNGVYTKTLDLYEGALRTESFVVNLANTSQRFVLSNPTVDTSAMAISVYEDGGQNVLAYNQAAQLYGVSDTSQVYFVQPSQNGQYEVVFGDGVYGRKPKDGSTVVVNYRACSGELPNGASLFSPDGAIDGHANISVTTVSSAVGGATSETLESIKYNAPRSFQAQNRAVTASDYETLLLNQFSDIQAISVYGGEETDPPRFGKVFISVDVADADGAPELRKKAFLDYIQEKAPLTVQAEFINPAFIYVQVTSTITYNINNTTKNIADIETAVQSAISSFNSTNLQNFNVSLYYSTLCSSIDGADQSILSNDTELFLIKRVIPVTNTDYSFIVETHNALQSETGVKLTVDEPHFGHTLTSTTFTYQDTACILVDDTLGNVFIAARQASTIQVIRNIGTINYTTGKVTIVNLNISAYEGNYIKLMFRTLSKNITSTQNAILQIDPIDVFITAVGVKQ